MSSKHLSSVLAIAFAALAVVPSASAGMIGSTMDVVQPSGGAGQSIACERSQSYNQTTDTTTTTEDCDGYVDYDPRGGLDVCTHYSKETETNHTTGEETVKEASSSCILGSPPVRTLL